tara:strand:+ start:326 stop:523 length:198 start_codon:yes stop_codon:yes gene_type:complete
MKINKVEHELFRIAPRTTPAGDNFVMLVAYSEDGHNDRVTIKLTSEELTSIIAKLSSLNTVEGEY